MDGVSGSRISGRAKEIEGKADDAGRSGGGVGLFVSLLLASL